MKISDFLYRLMVHKAGWFPDKFYIKKQFKHCMGYELNLSNPRTFQEKLQWLKLYDYKPIYAKMCDKYEVKSFVADVIGEQYTVPTLGLYDRAEDIDYSTLPNTFVMKTTHDSGTIVVCKDKSKLDIEKTNEYLNKRLKIKYYLKERELYYKDVKPRIIIEKLIGVPDEDLRDYKFFCFNGEPKLMFIISNRWGEGGHKTDFYDMDGKPMEIFSPGYENSETQPDLSPVFEEMKALASKLSKGIPHLRVDFYYTQGQIYVGELTFFDGGGYLRFEPDEYNKILGDWIIIK